MTEIVDWLLTPYGQNAIDVARRARLANPDPLAVASCMSRELDLPSLYRQAATLQAELRDRLAHRWASVPQALLTRDGIEQATHPTIRNWRARLLQAAGISAIADIGCGLGFESLSFVESGLRVRAVERDAETAAIAALNLRGMSARVDVFDAVLDSDSLTLLLNDVDAAFVDPARRDSSAPRSIDGNSGNRITDPESWSPSWSWVRELASQVDQRLVAKVAPGISHELLPENSTTVWFALKGSLAEASVWWPGFDFSYERAAIAVDRHGDEASLHSGMESSTVIGSISDFILDLSPAVTRSGLVQQAAAHTNAHRIDEHLGFLSLDFEPADSPLYVTYEVLEHFSLDEKHVSEALLKHGARDVEVISRGYRGSVDALAGKWRKRLEGDKLISVLLARVGDDVQAILAQRIS